MSREGKQVVSNIIGGNVTKSNPLGGLPGNAHQNV